jgi:hypothetical protein
VSPDKKLLAVVGDDRNALLVESRNGKVFFAYSFRLFWFMNLGFCGLIHNLLLLLPFFHYINIVRFFIKKLLTL